MLGRGGNRQSILVSIPVLTAASRCSARARVEAVVAIKCYPHGRKPVDFGMGEAARRRPGGNSVGPATRAAEVPVQWPRVK